MLARARAEAGLGVEDDLKIGPGGIREVEFFAQSLQLVWGGREPRVRGANTVEALRRLRARGFVTEREERELSDAYLFLRRLEHRIQFATGPADPQRAARPRDGGAHRALARATKGPIRSCARSTASERASRRGSRRSARPRRAPRSRPSTASGRRSTPRTRRRSPRRRPSASARGVDATCPRHLLALARPPHSPLGATTRDTDPAFARRLVGALADAADAEQATRLLAAFFARFATPGAYVRALADDPVPGQRRVLAARRQRLPRRVARGAPGHGRPRLLRARPAQPGGGSRAGRRRGGRAHAGRLAGRRRLRRRPPPRQAPRHLRGRPRRSRRASSARARSRTCSRRSPTRRSIRRAASRCASAGRSSARGSRAAT